MDALGSAAITGAAHITPEWLAETLRTAGVLPTDRSVTSVVVSDVPGGVIAKTVRLHIGYDLPVPHAPRSLVAKFPAEEELARALATMAGLYTREVRFYRELAPRLAMRVPRCYLGRIDDEGREFTLLLEDVTDATVHDQDEVWPAEDVLLAIHQLALLHAAHWNDRRLVAASWLNQLDGEQLPAWEALFRAAWQEFTGRQEVVLDKDLQALGERFCANGFATWVEGYHGPKSLVHADFHVSNLLFRTVAETGREVVTVDWQMAMHAAPLVDVAYFVGRMPTATRRAEEQRLVREYHDSLIAAGVADYSWAQCQQDYQRWAWYGVISALIAVIGTPMSTEHARLYCNKVTRYLTQVADNHSARFLG